MYHSSQTHKGGRSELLCLEPIDEVCVNFEQNEHHRQFDIPGLCFEFPSKTFDSQSLLMGQSSGDNLTDSTQQDGSTTQYSTLIACHNMPLDPPLPISSLRNQPDNKYRSRPCGFACVTTSSGNSVSREGKKRIRWTKDLHEKFVRVVNYLGGPKIAKPKAILEMMNTDALTILHVKSHLQKYRTTMYVEKAFQEGSVARDKTDGVTDLQLKIHMQIEESRQLQLQFRRSLQEQLETQRHLLMLIELQKKQLPMFDRPKLENDGL